VDVCILSVSPYLDISRGKGAYRQTRERKTHSSPPLREPRP
jgi:hypothetical protein